MQQTFIGREDGTFVTPALITAYFSPQPSPLPEALSVYSVQVCTTGSGATLSGGKLYGAAQARIVPVTRAGLLQAYAAAAHRSPWRYVAYGLEFMGAGMTIATQVKSNMIKERWKAGIPVAAGVIFAVEKSVKSQVPAAVVPDNMVPALMQIPERGCVEVVMFARPQQGETAFQVEVQP